MPISPEDRARESIARLLTAAGWVVQSRDETNISSARGVAIREFRTPAAARFSRAGISRFRRF